MGHEFGRQFAAAREARSITLTEAAEATKIREEYLSDIENWKNKWDVPDIYVRGFVKIYAEYLKLDVEKVMSECPIKQFEVFENCSVKGGSYNTVMANAKEEEGNCQLAGDDTGTFVEKTKALVEKLKKLPARQQQLIATAAVILIISVGVVAAKALSGHGHGPAATSATIQPVPEPQKLTLSSTDDVKIVVRDKKTGEKLFSGELKSGETREIQYSGIVQVFYDKGERLTLMQHNGEQMLLQPGRGAVEIK